MAPLLLLLSAMDREYKNRLSLSLPCNRYIKSLPTKPIKKTAKNNLHACGQNIIKSSDSYKKCKTNMKTKLSIQNKRKFTFDQ